MYINIENKFTPNIVKYFDDSKFFMNDEEFML
jgi:hypothetical protein